MVAAAQMQLSLTSEKSSVFVQAFCPTFPRKEAFNLFSEKRGLVPLFRKRGRVSEKREKRHCLCFREKRPCFPFAGPPEKGDIFSRFVTVPCHTCVAWHAAGHALYTTLLHTLRHATRFVIREGKRESMQGREKEREKERK